MCTLVLTVKTAWRQTPPVGKAEMQHGLHQYLASRAVSHGPAIILPHPSLRYSVLKLLLFFRETSIRSNPSKCLRRIWVKHGPNHSLFPNWDKIPQLEEKDEKVRIERTHKKVPAGLSKIYIHIPNLQTSQLRSRRTTGVPKTAILPAPFLLLKGW